MKKIRSHKLMFMIAAVSLLALAILAYISATIGVTYSLFSDKDSKEGVTANMATVDIELLSQSFAQSFTQSSGEASFEITNNSNINIYLRAGIIFELTTLNGEPVIADTGSITVDTNSPGWKADKSTLTFDNNKFTKWFLKYENSTGYTEVKPNENIAATFFVAGIPEDCVLIINVVPEAVQVDEGDDALKYFKNSGSVNPPW